MQYIVKKVSLTNEIEMSGQNGGLYAHKSARLAGIKITLFSSTGGSYNRLSLVIC